MSDPRDDRAASVIDECFAPLGAHAYAHIRDLASASARPSR
jgi:hypothetical protein